MTEILLIDDDEISQEIAAVYLEHGGHRVLAAQSGPQGLKLAAEKHPALILLDIAMPRMDGFEVLQALKANAETANIPVMFFSSYEHGELLQENQVHEHLGLISKSLDMETLNATVDLALRHPEFLQ